MSKICKMNHVKHSGVGWGGGQGGHNSIKLVLERKLTHVRHEQFRAPVDKFLLLANFFFFK